MESNQTTEAKNMEGVTIEYSVTAMDKKLQAIVDLILRRMDV